MSIATSGHSDRDRQDIAARKKEADSQVGRLLRERKAINSAIVTKQASSIQTSTPRRGPGLTEVRGTLGRRREYDLWLIRNVSLILNSEYVEDKIRAYCMTTIYGSEQSLNSAPETEYALQPDGTVLITSGRPPETPEQQSRDLQQLQLELETGGGPLVQDCAGYLYSFGTWHNQPMATDEKLIQNAATAKADLDEIDRMLDPRLIEFLPIQKP